MLSDPRMVSIDWSNQDIDHTTTGWLMEETTETFVVAKVRDWCMSNGKFECLVAIPKSQITGLSPLN